MKLSVQHSSLLTCCILLVTVSCLIYKCNGNPDHDHQQGADDNNVDVNNRVKRVAEYPKWVVGLKKPFFMNSPSNATVKKGGNARLLCRVRDMKRIKWFMNGTELDLSHSKNYVSTFTESDGVQVHVLQLSDIELTDAGYYQCIASNENGKSKSDIAFITVHVGPVFIKTPGNVTIKSKLSAKLECKADGEPHPEISWSKDGGYDFPAAKERRMHVMEDGQSFFITEVKVEDQGTYSCRAKNDAGEVTVNATLTVLEVPSFVKSLVNKKSMAGETSVMECIGAGSPKPSITWSKDGQPIATSDHRYFFTADNQLLIIVKSEESDSGVYSCQLDNFLGTARQVMTLTVAEPSTSVLPAIDYFTGFTIFIIFISFTVLTLIVYIVTAFCKSSSDGHHHRQTSKKKMAADEKRRRSKRSPSISVLNGSHCPDGYPPEITIIPDVMDMSGHHRRPSLSLSEGMTQIKDDYEDDYINYDDDCHSYYEDQVINYQDNYSSPSTRSTSSSR